MNDGEKQIVELLTEIRDGQREDGAYRRSILDESAKVQERAVRLQRLLLMLLVGVTVTVFGLIYVLVRNYLI